MKTINLLTELTEISIELSKKKSILNNLMEVEILYRYLMTYLKAIPEEITINAKPEISEDLGDWIKHAVPFCTHSLTKGYGSVSVICIDTDNLSIFILSQTSDELDVLVFDFAKETDHLYLAAVVSYHYILDKNKEPFSVSGIFHYNCGTSKEVYKPSTFTFLTDQNSRFSNDYKLETKPITILDYD